MQNLRININGINEKLGQGQPRFGLLFDIDGVIAHGTQVIPEAVEAFKLLTDSEGKFRYPVTFVTNGLDRDCNKARMLTNMLDIKVTEDQVITACSPLRVFTQFHHKRVLVIGQDNVDIISRDLGFTNQCYLDEVKEAFPDNDFVDHHHRAYLAEHHKKYDATHFHDLGKTFKPVEAILVLGEPIRWEGSLQLLIDLLMTNGNPDVIPPDVPRPHIPVLVCNLDLVFKATAKMPRFGNGAFMECLEHLYKRISGHHLQYSVIVGKPSEVTTRYAEHCLTRQAKKLGIKAPVESIYLVGDNPNVDICAANWYDVYLQVAPNRWFGENANVHSPYSPPIYSGEFVFKDEALSAVEKIMKKYSNVADAFGILPSCRMIPEEAEFEPITGKQCKGILVKTGVYSPEQSSCIKISRKHKDIVSVRDDMRPAEICDHVLDAVKYVLTQEGMPLVPCEIKSDEFTAISY